MVRRRSRSRTNSNNMYAQLMESPPRHVGRSRNRKKRMVRFSKAPDKVYRYPAYFGGAYKRKKGKYAVLSKAHRNGAPTSGTEAPEPPCKLSAAKEEEAPPPIKCHEATRGKEKERRDSLDECVKTAPPPTKTVLANRKKIEQLSACMPWRCHASAVMILLAVLAVLALDIDLASFPTPNGMGRMMGETVAELWGKKEAAVEDARNNAATQDYGIADDVLPTGQQIGLKAFKSPIDSLIAMEMKQQNRAVPPPVASAKQGSTLGGLGDQYAYETWKAEGFPELDSPAVTFLDCLEEASVTVSFSDANPAAYQRSRKQTKAEGNPAHGPPIPHLKSDDEFILGRPIVPVSGLETVCTLPAQSSVLRLKVQGFLIPFDGARVIWMDGTPYALDSSEALQMSGGAQPETMRVALNDLSGGLHTAVIALYSGRAASALAAQSPATLMGALDTWTPGGRPAASKVVAAAQLTFRMQPYVHINTPIVDGVLSDLLLQYEVRHMKIPLQGSLQASLDENDWIIGQQQTGGFDLQQLSIGPHVFRLRLHNRDGEIVEGSYLVSNFRYKPSAITAPQKKRRSKKKKKEKKKKDKKKKKKEQKSTSATTSNKEGRVLQGQAAETAARHLEEAERRYRKHRQLEKEEKVGTVFAGPAASEAASAVWEDSKMATLLWQLIHDGETEKLEELLETPRPEGGKKIIHVRSSDGRGPLWWAFEYEWLDIVRILIDHGADPKSRDASGKLPSDMWMGDKLSATLQEPQSRHKI